MRLQTAGAQVRERRLSQPNARECASALIRSVTRVTSAAE